MKFILPVILFVTLAVSASAQYYLRGIVKDENGKAIYNAKILLSTKGAVPFYTGSSGSFGIPLSKITDSIFITADGYELFKGIADTRIFGDYVLKVQNATKNNSGARKLSSLLPVDKDFYVQHYINFGETYTSLVENDFRSASTDPEAGFALNINRASYSNIRRFINNNMPVPPDAVRIEEMLNYFDFSNGDRNNNTSFGLNTQLTEAPWNNSNRLLFLNLHAPFVNYDTVKPTNLVFVIDISGSMDNPAKLPLLKDAFKMLVNNLRSQDTVAVVVYGGITGIYIQPVSCEYKDSINHAIDKLEAGGETPGAAALKMAYGLAERMFQPNANNRIILATDGDFNVGQTSEKELEELVVGHRQSGIYLTCLGVGMGNYKDSKLEAMAEKGNGNFAYIDNLNEAEKVLTSEFSKTLYSVADNAFVNVYFNPYYVKRYRLIGYDNKKDAVQDNVIDLDGGEVGSGHSFMAVFEIEPSGYLTDSLMLAKPETELARMVLHYQKPAQAEDITESFSIKNNFKTFYNTSSNIQFATSVIMMGGLLKQTDTWKNYDWDDVIKIARNAVQSPDYLRKEFIDLAEKAKVIYDPLRKKKKKSTFANN